MVRKQFLFTESFLQKDAPISETLFVKTVLLYLIENDVTFLVRKQFLFSESFLQKDAPISETLFVKTVLPYLIENDVNIYAHKLKIKN